MTATTLGLRERAGYFDLGFGIPTPDVASHVERAEELRPDGRRPLRLGRKKSTLSWQIAAWLALAMGMFSRQGIDLPDLVWKAENINAGAVVASLAVGLAMFPAMMRWFNRRRRTPGLEHVAAPFAFGFFLDLAVVAAIRVPQALSSQF